MQRMATAISSPAAQRALPHTARTINTLPGHGAASTLLAELATAPCAFSPAVADRPLALYGAGNMGRLAIDFLQHVGHKPALVIDRDASRHAQDPAWTAIPLLDLDATAHLADKNHRVAVSVVTAPYVPIERALMQLGFADIVPFYDLAESFHKLHPLSNGWFAPPMTALDQEMTAGVLAGWSDDISRAHHLQFLAWRRLRQEWSFPAAPVSTGDRFFIPEVTRVLHDDEFFVDGGAHHGSVLKSFATATKGAFRQIAAIEPDPFNRARLTDTLHSSRPERVAVYDCALAEAEGTALFHDGLGYASQLSPTGRINVAARPLDALCLSPTFVKLHLEGAELPALKGARQSLQAMRPIVAATVYHNADGIWKTPFWLMANLPDYRFLFRAHSWCGTGAVVYAIPRERKPALGA